MQHTMKVHSLPAAIRAALLAIPALGLLSACASLGPNYQRPAPLPNVVSEQAAVAGPLAQYKEAAKLLKPATPATGTTVASDWWKAFADPRLDALMTEVATGNQNIAQAEARYRQATASLQQTQAGQWPTLSTNASAARSSQATTAGRSTATSLSTSLAASWELDLWGRVRRSIEAGDASAAASAADLAATTLSLRAQLATSYGNLRSLDAQRALLEDSVEAYERSLKLTQNRYDAGVVARSDVAQAQLQLLNARAQLIDTDNQRAALEHAIAILLGRVPSTFALERSETYALKLPAVAASVPSELLRKRPDVIAAERRVAAANAQIGVTVAAYYPSITLSGSFGQRGANLSDLLSLPNRFWSVGPALALSLFDGGARDAAKAQVVAAYDQTVAAYRQTVLTAIGEVEDNLAAQRILAEELAVQQQAVKAAQESLTIALNQYKAGTVSYLNVVTAQTAEYSARRSELSLRAQQFTATVALLRALGS